MTADAPEIRTVAVERDLPFAPEKIWRALTQPHLIEEWLMKTDFRPSVGEAFTFTAQWGAVEGKVLAIEPERSISYSWNAMGLESVVTWTLTPTAGGTRLRMKQAGFKPGQDQAYHGAAAGWPRFFDGLERVLAGLD